MGVVADIILGYLLVRPLLLVELMVPLFLVSPRSGLVIEDIWLPHVLPLDNAYTIHLASLDIGVEFTLVFLSG